MDEERLFKGLRDLGRDLDVKEAIRTRVTWTGREMFGEVVYEPNWGPDNPS